MSDHAATENARAHEWESTVAWDKEIQAQLAAQAEQIKWWSECWDGKIPGCSKSESQAAAPFYTKSPPGHSEPQATAPENSVPNADLTKSYRAVSPTR
jgi:hypothetical protein